MLTWSPEYDIGIERIDRQHRTFLGLVNDYQAERQGTTDRKRLLNLLNEVLLYATFHFCSEENVMEELGYPELEQHVQQHIQLVDSLSNKITELQMSRCSPQVVETFLTDWLINHVLDDDSKIPLHAQRNLEKYRVTPR
jgi:hemerythrin